MIEYVSFGEFLNSPTFNKSKLNEAIKVSNFSQVAKLIAKYLTRKLGDGFSFERQIEVFNNARIGKNGKGLSFYFAGGKKKIRFNWKASTKIDSASLHSVDLWITPEVCYSMEFDTSVSIVSILPQVVDFIEKPEEGSFIVFPDTEDANLNESTSYLTEGKKSRSLDDIWAEFLGSLVAGTKPDTKTLHWQSYDIYRAARKMFPQFWNGLVYVGGTVGGRDAKFIIQQKEREILVTLGIIAGRIEKVQTSAETIVTPITPEIEEIAKKAEAVGGGIQKLAYAEMLEDLTLLAEELLRGVANGLFITGRGGVGKSYNIEQLLRSRGLDNGTTPRDNKAVWLNTSVSALSFYRKMAQNPDAIFLVDDADDIFKDDTGRNLLKAATDTKKVRVLNWAKKGDGVLPQNKLNMLIRQKQEALDRAMDGENIDKIAKLEAELESLEMIVPDKFEFRGRIIFISNLPIERLDPDGALRTRGSIIELYPEDEEVFSYMKKLVDLVDTSNIESEGGSSVSHDMRIHVIEVLEEYIKSGFIKKPLNMRMMEMSIKKYSAHIKVGGELWKRSLRYM